MASLILPNTRFIHVPKTGGNWVQGAIARAGIPFAVVDKPDAGHLEPERCPGRRQFTFAFVRHPLDWWRSYWRYKIDAQWDPQNSLDIECQDRTFAGFVNKVVARRRGYCSGVFARFTSGIDYIGRFESLGPSLVAALRAGGEQFDAEVILSTPPINRSDRRLDTSLQPVLEAALRNAERDAVERFGYR